VCWLDWPALERWLLAGIVDLLPSARLLPVAAGDGDETRRLAALPVRLLPGATTAPPPPADSSLRLPLAVAWGLAFVALAASGALLFGMATLGERRAAFVSAVTHELRTPLTTFRMYSDMLLEGMVASDEQRQHYLRHSAARPSGRVTWSRTCSPIRASSADATRARRRKSRWRICTRGCPRASRPTLGTPE
jgi:signal transduction histidine kinase